MKKTHGLTAAILAAALFATGCAPTETKRGTAEVVDDDLRAFRRQRQALATADAAPAAGHDRDLTRQSVTHCHASFSDVTCA